MPVASVEMTPSEFDAVGHRARRSRDRTRPAESDQRRHHFHGNNPSTQAPGAERNRRRHTRRHENMIIVADLARMKGGRDHSEISCCVKYTVFAFNVIFWFVGFTILLLGAWALVEKNPYSEITPRLVKFYLDPAWLLVIVGGIVFIIGFSGCIGALRENTCFLAFYSILLGVLLIAQIALCVSFFVAREFMTQELKRELNSAVVHYRDDPDLQSIIDWVQEALHCCGVDGADDWDMNIYFNKSSLKLPSIEAGGVPFSCCQIEMGANATLVRNLYCGHHVRMPNYNGPHTFYTAGCFTRLLQWLYTHVQYVGFSIIVITVLEILGVCFAQNLRSDIFAQRARWRHQY